MIDSTIIMLTIRRFGSHYSHVVNEWPKHACMIHIDQHILEISFFKMADSISHLIFDFVSEKKSQC